VSKVLQQIFHDAHLRHLEFRRYDTCFHAFAGAVVEAFRERNYRLVGFDSGASSLFVDVEQPDGDRIRIRLEPYRTEQTFMRSLGPVVELVCTLFQHIEDPDTIAAAQAGMLQKGVGRMLGAFSSHDDLRPDSRLSEPGNLRFNLHGAEVVASINLILNLKDYSINSLDFDKDKVGSTLDALIYGLEKFVGGILERHMAPG